MRQVIISSETPESKTLEKSEDKSAAAAVIHYLISSPPFYRLWSVMAFSLDIDKLQY